MKEKFINAYCYCYGETKRRAKEIYKTASEMYIKEVIKAYEHDIIASMYED